MQFFSNSLTNVAVLQFLVFRFAVMVIYCNITSMLLVHLQTVRNGPTSNYVLRLPLDWVHVCVLVFVLAHCWNGTVDSE